jgi:hypothetical protein
MVGLCQLVDDPMLITHPIEDVAAEEGLDLGVAVAVLGQIGEGHAPGSGPKQAVVGQYGMNLIGEHLDDLAQEGGAVQPGVGVQEGDMGEARSIARNMKSLSWAKRNSQMSMWA